MKVSMNLFLNRHDYTLARKCRETVFFYMKINYGGSSFRIIRTY